jgi:hypothetical protein
VTLVKAELSQQYLNEFNAPRNPPAGMQFAWAQVQVTNTGSLVTDIPLPENFSLLYYQNEYKPTYGRRQGYIDYTGLNKALDPGGTVEAWLRFDVPADARLEQLLFAYLPETIRVSFSSSQSDLSWARHPVHLWRLAP